MMYTRFLKVVGFQKIYNGGGMLSLILLKGGHILAKFGIHCICLYMCVSLDVVYTFSQLIS